jgi:hypothetical protein
VKSRRRLIAIATGALLLLGGVALAYLTTNGFGSASASAATLAAPTGVTVPLTSGSTVNVSWTASSPPGSGAVAYYVQRYVGLTPSAACGTSLSSTISTTSCNDTGVVNGTYTYRVTAVWRTWTTQSAPSGSVTVQNDNVAPSTTITFAPSSPNGSSSWYKTTAPTFALSASDTGGSGVANTFYKIDAGAQQTYASAVTIPEGQHTITYWSVDNAANTETQHTTGIIKVDISAPVTMISVSPASPNGSSGWYKTTAPTFTLLASDILGGSSGVSTTFYKIDAGPQLTYSGAVTVPEGQHTISYWSQDVAGNIETTQVTATIKVDVTPPVTTIAVSPSSPNGSSGWYKTTAPTFTLTASDSTGGNSGVSSTFYKIDAGTQQTYASAVTIPEGQHTISYWSQDVAGNSETTHTTATIKVDVTIPTLSLAITGASSGTLAAGLLGDTVYFQDCPAGSYGFRFIGTVSDGTSGAVSVSYPGLTANQWDSHASGETIVTPSGGPYTSSDFLWSPNNCSGSAAAAPGIYTITAADAAGNISPLALSFLADRTLPTVTNVTLNNGGGAPQQGTIGANDFVEVTYGEAMDPSSFCSTWTNGTTPTLTSGVTVTISSTNVLSVSATPTCTFHFGNVTLNAGYNTGTTMTFTTGSSLIWDPATKKLKIVLGSRSGGTPATGVAVSTPSYANGAATRESDFAQNMIPTSSVNGTSSRF